MTLTPALRAKWHEMAVREVSTQCQLGIAASNYITEGIHRAETDRVFSSIQALLSHTANVSKMLRADQDPSSRARALHQRMKNWLYRLMGRRLSLVRRPTIGDLLDVPRAPVVHRDGRRFRNDVEHYDERLLRWLRRTGAQVTILDFNVMPKNAVRLAGNHIFVRNLDPNTLEFTLADRDLPLAPLVVELQRIQEAANNWIAQNVE
jgi:hypothetical protein